MVSQRFAVFIKLAAFAVLLALGVTPAFGQQREPSGLEAALSVERALIEAIAKAEHSVVAIARVTAQHNAFPHTDRRENRFDRLRQPITPASPRDPDFIPNDFGTGVVIDRRGVILTQYHVVKQGDEHWVTTSDRHVYPAKIRGADPRSGLAVLEVDATDLVPIKFGDAGTLRRGQIVIALGNPYSIARDGQASASWGIVSNLSRKAGPEPSGEMLGRRETLHHFGTLIQTDAKLNLGTSGGALVNLQGEMVGLTTALAATAGYEMAAGYAIPIDKTFRRVIDLLKEGREVEYGLLGVRPENLHSEDLRQGRQGMRVRDIVEGSPAAKYGIRSNDIISHVNGQSIHDADGLVLEVGRLPALATARLTVHRGREVKQIDVTLAKYPVPGVKIVTNRPAPWRGLTVDFVTAIEDYEKYAQLGEIDLDGCILIASVEEGSPCWNQGLRSRMFISHVEGVRVRTPDDFYDAVAGKKGPVRLQLTMPQDHTASRTIPAAD